jgi:hypothetical protein
MSRLHEPNAAIEEAARRFGNPSELSQEFEAALPFHERVSYGMERWFAWRAPESAARYSFRTAVVTFWLVMATLMPVEFALYLYWGWIDAVQIVARVFVSIVLFTPPAQFLLAFLTIRMRNSYWGVFGFRRSRLQVIAFALAVVAVVTIAGFGSVAVAGWSVERAIEFLPLVAIMGILFAMVSMVSVQLLGPTTIRDTIWALLDIGGAKTRGDGRAGGDDRAAELA